MSGIIKLLPDHISNQIAAGEVIQRPASAVKELMENSIDAGATSIKVIIKEAGKSLIQIIDNGIGMNETDARLCFEKHATSKIRNIDDLFSIKTMGFRGEAMASIAAIAQVEMKTKTHDATVGIHISIEGSEILDQSFCECAAGTQLTIKNLFYNVPARRNFLKSNAVELKHIIDEFERIALAHPAISFSFINNDYEIFHLNSGNLRQRIVSIFGENYNSKLVPLEEKSDQITVYGFTGKPDLTKKTRGEQFIFVNKRFIKSQYLNHAVMRAYDEMIPKDVFPFYCIFIDIAPALIDINVHPTKQEIKFEDDRLVYTFVNAGIRHSLAQYSIAPTLDFELEANINNWEAFGLSASKKESDEVIVERANQSFNARKDFIKNSNISNWEELYKIAATQNATTPATENASLIEQDTSISLSNQHYQIHSHYIATQTKAGFILLDQSLAHERILYEKYIQSIAKNKSMSQKKMFAQNIEFTAQDSAILLEILPDINALGFDIQHFGGNSFVIHSLPVDIQVSNEKKMIEELLEQYKNNLSIQKLNARDNIARSLAKSSCIKVGKNLSSDEMNTIVEELFQCENPYSTPNGTPTFITFELDMIQEKFLKK
ncbi:MAG: DNA mismatch repair endonuclease MutL [Bacteroidota bacterium]